MLKIDRDNQVFQQLETQTLRDVSFTERYDLQAFICNSPDAFFNEIGQELFLIGQEILPSETVGDRIDILGVDKEGVVVVIELKRGNHKLHMMQAVSYAGMVSQWKPERFLNELDQIQQDDLENFLDVGVDEINRSQRIILVAEQYDYALLVGADWLCDNYGVDIQCCRISVATDGASKSEFLVCSNVYPAPELVKEAIKRGNSGGRTGASKSPWDSWEDVLDDIESPSVRAFYSQQLAEDCENYLRKRILYFRIDGKRRWFVAARKDRAYVWQYGRFENDMEFWSNSLSDGESVKPVKRNSAAVFYLSTESDFSFFLQAVSKDLARVDWLDRNSSLAQDESELMENR